MTEEEKARMTEEEKARMTEGGEGYRPGTLFTF